jgi:hypothetical protein
VSALDATIDDLYRLPLSDFTGTRNALAKSLTGSDALRVRALVKPTVVPWAVNQVYWRARSTYDRLMQSGEALRVAQIAALEGRAADVRAASDAHRRAVGEAVSAAERLAAPAGAKANADALARTFEALSLATHAPASPGRLTGLLQPAGFEALAGIQPVEASDVGRAFQARQTGSPKRAALHQTRNAKTAAKEAKERERAAEEAARSAAERKKHEALVKEAEATVARVEMTERASRETWERAHDELLAARQALSDLKRARKA